MTEQEISKDYKGFPKAPKQAVIKYWEEVSHNSFDIVKAEKSMSEKDPHLRQALDQLGSECGHEDCKREFLGSAFLLFDLLESLEAEGISLPRVSEGVAATYVSEYQVAQGTIGELKKEGEVYTSHSEFHELIAPAEFNFPKPINYAEENPNIMVFVGEVLGQAREGAMYVYELKRRQFFADKLEKEFPQ